MRERPTNDSSLMNFAPEVARDFQVILKGLQSLMRSPLARQHLVLTGGIALHVFHSEGNPSRLTKDIDFNFRSSDIEDEKEVLETLRNQIDEIVKESLVSIGVDPANIYVNPSYPLSRIGGHVPLGMRGQTLDLKIEVGYTRRIPLLKDKEITLANEFGIDEITVKVPQLEEVITSKMGALLNRAYPRDLFDVHYAMNLSYNPLLLRKCFIMETLMVLDAPVWETDFESTISGISYDTALANVLPVQSATKDEFIQMKEMVIKKLKEVVNSLTIEERKGIELFYSDTELDFTLLDAESVFAPSISKHPLLRRQLQEMKELQEHKD
ncbi:MAG: nucleotidyl transferase AbiEii/AbiGii toxin family protein [Candidatus Thorarchaeota archaeon]